MKATIYFSYFSKRVELEGQQLNGQYGLRDLLVQGVNIAKDFSFNLTSPFDRFFNISIPSDYTIKVDSKAKYTLRIYDEQEKQIISIFNYAGRELKLIIRVF